MKNANAARDGTARSAALASGNRTRRRMTCKVHRKERPSDQIALPPALQAGAPAGCAGIAEWPILRRSQAGRGSAHEGGRTAASAGAAQARAAARSYARSGALPPARGRGRHDARLRGLPRPAERSRRNVPIPGPAPSTWRLVRADSVTLVPILRAGPGLPPRRAGHAAECGAVSVLGLRRNEVTHQPETYYERLADRMERAHRAPPRPDAGHRRQRLQAQPASSRQAGCTRQVKCLFLVAAPEGLARTAKPRIPTSRCTWPRSTSAWMRMTPTSCPAWAMPATGLFGTPVD
jgi:hypothetical protein